MGKAKAEVGGKRRVLNNSRAVELKGDFRINKTPQKVEQLKYTIGPVSVKEHQKK